MCLQLQRCGIIALAFVFTLASCTTAPKTGVKTTQEEKLEAANKTVETTAVSPQSKLLVQSCLIDAVRQEFKARKTDQLSRNMRAPGRPFRLTFRSSCTSLTNVGKLPHYFVVKESGFAEVIRGNGLNLGAVIEWDAVTGQSRIGRFKPPVRVEVASAGGAVTDRDLISDQPNQQTDGAKVYVSDLVSLKVLVAAK